MSVINTSAEQELQWAPHQARPLQAQQIYELSQGSSHGSRQQYNVSCTTGGFVVLYSSQLQECSWQTQLRCPDHQFQCHCKPSTSSSASMPRTRRAAYDSVPQSATASANTLSYQPAGRPDQDEGCCATSTGAFYAHQLLPPGVCCCLSGLLALCTRWSTRNDEWPSAHVLEAIVDQRRLH